MRTSLVFVALLVAVAFADSDISIKFETDVNLTDAAENFFFRYQYAKMIETPTITSLILQLPKAVYVWSSSSVNVEKASKEKIADANAMFAVAVPSGISTFPFTILGYAEGKTAVSLELDDLFKNMIGSGFSSTFNGGIIGMAALSLEEYTPKGDYVDGTFISLKSKSISDACTPEKVKEKSGVKGMTCSQKVNGKKTKIITTYLTSEKAGILKYGKTPVSPRSIEMIIEVQDFELTNKNNHVRLNLGFITASGDGKIDGNVKYIKNDGEKVYVAASGYAVVGDDERVEVGVKVESKASTETSTADFTNFNAFAKAAFGGNVDLNIAHIDFPAGESSFIYDPAAGSGSVVYEAGASTIALSALAVLFCVLLFLF